MAQYKAIAFWSETEQKELGCFETKGEAIFACVDWAEDEGELDNDKEELISGLETRGYSCLGYSSCQLLIEEID